MVGCEEVVGGDVHGECECVYGYGPFGVVSLGPA